MRSGAWRRTLSHGTLSDRFQQNRPDVRVNRRPGRRCRAAAGRSSRATRGRLVPAPTAVRRRRRSAIDLTIASPRPDAGLPDIAAAEEALAGARDARPAGMPGPSSTTSMRRRAPSARDAAPSPARRAACSGSRCAAGWTAPPSAARAVPAHGRRRVAASRPRSMPPGARLGPPLARHRLRQRIEVDRLGHARRRCRRAPAPASGWSGARSRRVAT